MHRSSIAVGLGVLVACLALSCAQVAPDAAPMPDARDPETCGVRPAEGCPCEGDQSVVCREAPVARDGGLSCRTGTRSCRGGLWSGCESVVETLAPGSQEGRAVAALITGPVQCSSCDPACYTQTDQPGPADLPGRSTDVTYDPGAGGVTLTNMPTMCMSAACTTTTSQGVGSGNPWMPGPTNSDGVVVDPVDGALTLGFTTVNSRGVWVSSMNGAYVSRLDPTTAQEVGRYPSARPDAFNRARPWNEGCNWRNRGNCPSRTAVDQNYDVYVANRAFGNQGTVTKIAGALAGCRDRNGDGFIQTSRDLNGNGRIDMGTAEFVGPNDECILWTVPVGRPGGVPRALTVGVAPGASAVGDVWVGMYSHHEACRLSPTTGAGLGCVDIAPIYPYGAVTDPRGRIWFSSRRWTRDQLGQVEPTTMRFRRASLAPTFVVGYGVAAWSSPDLSQTYVFVADSDNNAILRYDPDRDRWFRRDLGAIPIPPRWVCGWVGSWWWRRWVCSWRTTTSVQITPRGLAADLTHLWVANYTNGSRWSGGCSNTFYRLDIPSLNNVANWSVPPSTCYCGIGVGFDNAVWVVASGTNNVVRLAPDRASAIVTPRIFNGLYTYSDFIGFGLNTFANPRGHYSFATDSGPTCTTYRWSQLTWDATLLPGTTVELWVRSSNSVAGLATQAWIGPFTTSPADLMAPPGPVPAGRYLETDVRLATSDRTVTPRVRTVSATGLCDTTGYAPTGRYTQTYDSSLICNPGERPTWGDLAFIVNTPSDSRIEFEVRTSNDPTTVGAATPIRISVPPSVSPVNLDALLTATGHQFDMVMSVTAVLYSSTDRMSSPILYEFSVNYTCAPVT